MSEINTVFCLKCKCQQELNNEVIKQTKNNKYYKQGECKKCNCKCNRFIKKPLTKLDTVLEEFKKESV